MDRRSFMQRSLAATAAAANPETFRAAFQTQAAQKLRVGIIGCGRMGQQYAEVYRALPDTELVAIAEWNDDRRQVVGRRFGVKALYKDVNEMLGEIVPDLAAVITPTKYMKEAVIACAEAGVKGVSTDKPIAARLSDADEMVEACTSRNVVFAGGNLQRAKWEVQYAALRLHSGRLGRPEGAAIHGFGGQISGGGCQHLSVLRLFARAEVSELIAWGSPAQALKQQDDRGLNINARFRMTSGLDSSVFGLSNTHGSKENRNGVDVWTENSLVRWEWGVPRIFQGRSAGGTRKEVDPEYPPFPWAHVLESAGLSEGGDYLVSSIRSFIAAVVSGSPLWISGHDLRQALEIAIACKLSAQIDNQPVRLPLSDRSLALFPSPYRWLGGDASGRPQSVEEAAGKDN